MLLGLLAAMMLQSTPAASAPLHDVVSRFPGEIGIFAKNLSTGETIAINADARFPTASVIKIAVMAETMQQVADGALSLDAIVRLRDEARVGGSGTLRELHDGAEVTLRDLLHLMIVVSDNTATNLLLEKVGTLKVNARMEAYGLKQTKIFRPTFRGGQPDCCPEEEREFGLGMSTPREMAALMELIATGRAVSAAASAQMFDILARQQDRQMIARRLPLGADSLKVANKTGTDEEKLENASGVRGHVRGDAAIVETSRGRYVLVVFTRRVRDDSWTPDHAALLAGAEVSRIVYDAFHPGDHAKPSR
jgi:beta-lactamase class A